MASENKGYILPEEIDPPRRCVQLYIPGELNHQLAFWGALDELALWFNWQRDNDHTAIEVAHVWREVIDLAHALFNSDNPCPCEGDDMIECCEPILEKLDQIIALLDAPRQSDPIAQIEFRQTISNILNAPGFEVSDLHPSAPDVSYTEGTGDIDAFNERQSALCHILWLAIIKHADALRADILSKGIPIAIELVLTGQFWLGAALAIATSAAQELVRLALEDEGAVRNVVCCMRDALIGQATTKTNFQAAALSCEVGGNETLIGDALYQTFANDDNWGVFIRDLGEAFDMASDGQDLECPCDSEGITCESSNPLLGYDYDTNPFHPAFVPDGDGGLCDGFWRIIEGGATWTTTQDMCIESVHLEGHRLSEVSECAVVRWTVNGAFWYTLYNPANNNISIAFDPPQLVLADETIRMDFFGGSERVCNGIFRVNFREPEE